MKNIIWALIVLVVAGGAYYAYSKGMFGDMAMKDSQEKMMASEPTITWNTTDAGEREDIPYTHVAVTVNGTLYEVGDFQGSCSEVGATGGVDGKGLLAGELSAVQCWYAGGGDEIGVFAVEDGSYEIMVGQLDEPTEGSGGFRGNFEIKTQIKI